MQPAIYLIVVTKHRVLSCLLVLVKVIIKKYGGLNV
ncbi:MAG: hypothetical protein H6Q72_2522 [Firmicutes bacterium]|nr:hypothetical protein [Bacillota bacterium]